MIDDTFAGVETTNSGIIKSGVYLAQGLDNFFRFRIEWSEFRQYMYRNSLYLVIYDINFIICLYFLDTMPSFEESTCQGQTQADMCIAVSFSNGAHDTLVLNRASEASSIYEGFLQGARDIPAVVIDIPMHNKRFVSNFHQYIKRHTFKKLNIYLITISL